MKAKSSLEGLRTYQVPWELLKKQGKIHLLVIPPLEARVRKAISKEKDMDAAHKFMLAEDDRTSTLIFSYDAAEHVLTVELTITLGLGDI